jgi:hypothetical protein
VRPRREVADQRGRRDRDRPRDQDLAADQVDVVVDVLERRREHRNPADPAILRQRDRRLADALTADPLDARGHPPRARRRRGRQVARQDRRALQLRVGDDEVRLRPALAGPHAEDRHPRVRLLREPAHEPAQLALVDAALHRAAEALGARQRDGLQAAQLFGGEARVELRDDVEVDEPDRRRRDREEEQDEPVADAVERQRRQPAPRPPASQGRGRAH